MCTKLDGFGLKNRAHECQNWQRRSLNTTFVQTVGQLLYESTPADPRNLTLTPGFTIKCLGCIFVTVLIPSACTNSTIWCIFVETGWNVNAWRKTHLHTQVYFSNPPYLIINLILNWFTLYSDKSCNIYGGKELSRQDEDFFMRRFLESFICVTYNIYFKSWCLPFDEKCVLYYSTILKSYFIFIPYCMCCLFV